MAHATAQLLTTRLPTSKQLLYSRTIRAIVQHALAIAHAAPSVSPLATAAPRRSFDVAAVTTDRLAVLIFLSHPSTQACQTACRPPEVAELQAKTQDAILACWPSHLSRQNVTTLDLVNPATSPYRPSPSRRVFSYPNTTCEPILAEAPTTAPNQCGSHRNRSVRHGTGTTRPPRRQPPCIATFAQMVALSGNNDTSTALQDQPSSRSFFSRFTLPIRSRSTRNLIDFHIRPAEPHRKYNAGDPVKGAVVLAIVKPIRVTHLTVALRGFVRVYKNPNAANEPFVTPELVSDGVSQFRFLGNGYASLFQDEQVLCADGRLEAGRYEFNFELMFPEHGLPSSIEVSLQYPRRDRPAVYSAHTHTHIILLPATNIEHSSSEERYPT